MSVQPGRTPENLTYRQIIGDGIRRLREERDLSQRELAEATHPYLVVPGREHPWKKQTVSAIENGNRAVDADELLVLAVVLNVNVIDLLRPAWRGEVLGRDDRVVMPSTLPLRAEIVEDKTHAYSYETVQHILQQGISEARRYGQQEAWHMAKGLTFVPDPTEIFQPEKGDTE